MSIDVDEARFWAKVSIPRDVISGCWEWTASTTSHGYGQVVSRGKHHQSHRVAYRLVSGDIPPGDGFHGTCVLHRCDNPLCCNPAHLFLGSNHDNVRDMVSKGRARGRVRVGVENNMTKLTPQQVVDLRARAVAGETFTDLGRRFGISRVAAANVAKGKVWKSVPMEGG